MEFLNSKKFIFIMLMILIWAGLQGCVHKTDVTTKNPTLPNDVNATVKEEKPHTEIDSIGKMQGVANALVCMFSPDSCDSVTKGPKLDR